MKTELFDYFLPPELIAQVPADKRSESRLLVYERDKKRISHRQFSNIVDYFEPGDLLIVNSSKVIPARLYTKDKIEGSKECEVFFIKLLQDGRFEAMVKPGKKFKVGRKHTLPGNTVIEVEEILDSGLRIMKTTDGKDPVEVFRKYGEMPLPPYITSRESEPERYQTVYSKLEGSVAAPTAGLHFDENVFKALKDKGVKVAEVILHVGLGTFKPVEADDLDDHQMHEEVFFVPDETAKLFKETKERNNKVWACGTTSVRTLESAIRDDKTLKTGWQATTCFIKPGYKFLAIDHFITNFHLPKSTLIVLVSAFAGREEILNLYAEAIKEKYRFYSFGDSMVMI